MTVHASAALAQSERAQAAAACAADVASLTAACAAMAARFRRGGTLFTFGVGEAGTDAQHVAVEFVHPVIVGKRALPALALTNDAPTVTGFAAAGATDLGLSHQLRCLAGRHDMVLGLTCDASSATLREVAAASRELGLLTVALVGEPPARPVPGVDHVVSAHSRNPRIVKEMHVTAYHVLWELVHLMLAHPDRGESR